MYGDSIAFNTIDNSFSPTQMMQAAGADWEVQKVPAYVTINEKRVAIDRSALVRKDTWEVLDTVPNEWNEVQNITTFEFFKDWCDQGSLTMETAGVMLGGRVVWCLAKLNTSFEAVPGDVIEPYIMLTNQHRYGRSTSVSWSAKRIACNNAVQASLSKAAESEKIIRVHHSREFIAADVKETLALARQRLETYENMSKLLASSQATKEQLVEYFKQVFPSVAKTESKINELSRNASRALEILEVQPGADFGRGSWWQAFNTVSYMTDHLLGRDENRLYSSWYGGGRDKKRDALELAVTFATI